MIKINTQTLTPAREALPKYLHGLDADTLRNLQTVAKPVPPHILNVEYWPENDITPPIDEAIEKYGDEILIVDAPNKVVNVSRQVVPLTSQELADKQAIIDEKNRINGIEAAVNNDTIINQLKTMTSAEYDAWFSANVTTSAQAIQLLKRLTRVIIRRVL